MNAPAWYLGQRSLGLCHLRPTETSTRFVCGAAVPPLPFRVDGKTHRRCKHCLAASYAASFVADLVVDLASAAAKAKT